MKPILTFPVLLLAVFSPSVFGHSGSGSGSREVTDGVSECYSCSYETSNYYCRRDQDKQSCSSGEYCQTEMKNDNGALTINKKCKKAKDCEKAEDNNDALCKDGLVRTKCSYCCKGELCNEGLEKYHEPYENCGAWSPWSGCSSCRRERTRQCSVENCSKSKSCSGGRSRRMSDDENNAMEVEDDDDDDEVEVRVARSKGKSSQKRSGEQWEESEIDDCCNNTCYECDSLIVSFFWADAYFSAFLRDNCYSVYCPEDQPLCQTTYVFDDFGIPRMSRGCTSSTACKEYEDSDVCPIMVSDNAEALYVGLTKAGAGTKCNYCCDNGADEHGVICNSGLVPPAEYLTDGASSISACTIAFVVMLIAAFVVSM